MKFRHKPIVIDAVKFDGSIESITKMALEMNMPIEKYVFSLGRFGTIIIPTLEGNMITMVGDWVIKGIIGEFYPIKDEIFKLTYEKEIMPDIFI